MSAATQQRRFAEARSDDFVFSLLRARSRAKTCALVPAVPVCISMGMKNASPDRAVVRNELELQRWLEVAKPGTSSIYHVGHLACDRSPDMSNLNAGARANLNSTAHRVMALVEQGAVLAVQQRLDDGRIAYLAIKPLLRPSRSRKSHRHAPLLLHRPVPPVTNPADAITAAEGCSALSHSCSSVNTSTAQSPGAS